MDALIFLQFPAPLIAGEGVQDTGVGGGWFGAGDMGEVAVQFEHQKFQAAQRFQFGEELAALRESPCGDQREAVRAKAGDERLERLRDVGAGMTGGERAGGSAAETLRTFIEGEP